MGVYGSHKAFMLELEGSGLPFAVRDGAWRKAPKGQASTSYSAPSARRRRGTRGGRGMSASASTDLDFRSMRQELRSNPKTPDRPRSLRTGHAVCPLYLLLARYPQGAAATASREPVESDTTAGCQGLRRLPGSGRAGQGGELPPRPRSAGSLHVRGSRFASRKGETPASPTATDSAEELERQRQAQAKAAEFAGRRRTCDTSASSRAAPSGTVGAFMKGEEPVTLSSVHAHQGSLETRVHPRYPAEFQEHRSTQTCGWSWRPARPPAAPHEPILIRRMPPMPIPSFAPFRNPCWSPRSCWRPSGAASTRPTRPSIKAATTKPSSNTGPCSGATRPEPEGQDRHQAGLAAGR